MAPGPITSLQIDGKTMETVIDFIFLGSKITVDGEYSHKINSWVLLGIKAMTNLGSILKSRDTALSTKVQTGHSQGYGFSNSHVLMREFDHKEN